MYTIGQLARRCRLSRSTLLYYDSVGLLTATSRSDGNYRLYSDADAERLSRICAYRQAGLELSDIAVLLGDKMTAATAILERRIHEVSEEIGRLREQRSCLVTILQKCQLAGQGALNHERWLSLMEAAGLDKADRWRWHHEFEIAAPEMHEAFLLSLGFPGDEVAALRMWARADKPAVK